MSTNTVTATPTIHRAVPVTVEVAERVSSQVPKATMGWAPRGPGLKPQASEPLRVGLARPGEQSLQPGSIRFSVDGVAYGFDAPAGQRAFVSRGDRGFRMIYPSKIGPSALAFLNLPALEKGTYEDHPNAWAVFATGAESYISRPTCGPFVIHVDRVTEKSLWGRLEGTFCAGSAGTATINARFAADRP